MTYEKLCQARERLGLQERVSRSEIVSCYRRLVKECHPDLNDGLESDRIRQITEAYRLLSAYCDTYTFSFSYDEYLMQNPEELMRRQFADDPVWGGS